MFEGILCARGIPAEYSSTTCRSEIWQKIIRELAINALTEISDPSRYSSAISVLLYEVI